ncbi:MAG: M48 family metallopeptidase, partial [Chloroflexi bacterium]|nr:M48 family metallopeptidase [Chloroflexota bacterium]
PKRYGLSIQKFVAWLGDEAKAKGLSLALGAGGVALIYWFIIRFPSTWWLLGWAVVVLFGILLTHVAPILIVPLFLKMKPLADEELRQRLERLAERAKTRVRGIYSIEFSKKGTTANAALMGLGSTRRIVLSDTLLQKYSPLEIESVLAHELGHHRHRDIFRLFAVQSAIWLIGFYVVNIALRAGVRAFGYSGMADVAALPLLMLIAAAFGLLFFPLLNTFSRHVESAADEYALKLTDDPKSFAKAMARLTDQNLSEAQPPRWVELLIYDHPSYQNRLEHAKQYAINRVNQQNQGDILRGNTNAVEPYE